MGSSNTGAGAGAGTKEEINMEEPVNAEPLALEYPNSSVFSEGDKVLAYHCGLLYEAKVQRTECRKDEWKYFVHYLGWSKNWDEWLGTDCLLKFTDENRNKLVLLKNHSSDKLPKSGQPVQIKPQSSNDEKPDKEDLKNNDEKPDKEDLKNNGQAISFCYAAGDKKNKSTEADTKSQDKHLILRLPLTLKKQLIDDSEFVNQLGKLLKLPRSPNVDDILKKYLDYRQKKDGKIVDPVIKMLKGLRSYFDKALSSMLLYKKERQQYIEAICDDISPSTIYGAEHLLRLFVKLPELLSYVNMEEEALENLQQNLLDFLKFLQKNQSCFFLSTYDGLKNSGEADDKRR